MMNEGMRLTLANRQGRVVRHHFSMAREQAWTAVIG
jgi:hypothetical protein